MRFNVKISLFTFGLFLCFAHTANAQGLLRPMVQATGRILPKQAAKLTLSSGALLPEMKEAQGTASLPQDLTRNIFLLKENGFLLRYLNRDMRATAFAIEETYQGKTYVWGVTAAHYLLENPAMIHPKQRSVTRVHIEAQGNPGMTDILLFPIPEKMRPHIHPFKLALRNPREGEKLHSVGYFNNSYHVEENRIVQEANTQRIITSIVKTKEQGEREGACGSPVLNEKNQVVGVHIGSSYRQQIGYVVPLNRLRQLIYAVHHNGQAPEQLIFNGVPVRNINVNEQVIAVETYDKGKMLQRRKTLRQEKEIDYTHLEKWIPLEGAERVHIIIEQTPLSPKRADDPPNIFIIAFDLKTNTFTTYQDDLYPVRAD